METVEIREYGAYQEDEILPLYRSVGWSVYYRRPELLKKAFENSLCVLAAYDGDRLAGLIRGVGDGYSVVLIQDVLVRPEYQRRGIGSTLVYHLKARYNHVRQMHLLTDDTVETVGFYQAVGFTPLEEIRGRAFTRLPY